MSDTSDSEVEERVATIEPVVTRNEALDHIARNLSYGLSIHADKTWFLDLRLYKRHYQDRFHWIRYPPSSSAVLEESERNNEASLEPHLQSGLEYLDFTGGPIFNKSLHLLKERSPGVKELRIEDTRDSISPEALSAYIQSANYLNRLSITKSMGTAANTQVFFAAAASSSLESFYYNSLITEGIVSRAFDQLVNTVRIIPFPELKRLKCVAEWNSLPSLLRYLQRLSELEVTCTHAVAGLLSMAGFGTFCPSLWVLKLNFTSTEEPFEMSELVKLVDRSLVILEVLEIGGMKLNVEGFKNSYFAELLGHIPRLRFLTLAWAPTQELTEFALVETAKRRGKALEHFEFWGPVDMRRLEKSGVSFPLMKSLVIGSMVSPFDTEFKDEMAAEAAYVVRLLRRIAPMLTKLNMVDGAEFDALVEEGWEKLTNTKRINGMHH